MTKVLDLHIFKLNIKLRCAFFTTCLLLPSSLWKPSSSFPISQWNTHVTPSHLSSSSVHSPMSSFAMQSLLHLCQKLLLPTRTHPSHITTPYPWNSGHLSTPNTSLLHPSCSHYSPVITTTAATTTTTLNYSTTTSRFTPTTRGPDATKQRCLFSLPFPLASPTEVCRSRLECTATVN